MPTKQKNASEGAGQKRGKESAEKRASGSTPPEFLKWKGRENQEHAFTALAPCSAPETSEAPVSVLLLVRTSDPWQSFRWPPGSQPKDHCRFLLSRHGITQKRASQNTLHSKHTSSGCFHRQNLLPFKHEVRGSKIVYKNSVVRAARSVPVFRASFPHGHFPSWKIAKALAGRTSFQVSVKNKSMARQFPTNVTTSCDKARHKMTI